MSAGYFWFGVDVGTEMPSWRGVAAKKLFSNTRPKTQKVCAVTAPLERVSRRSSGWSVPCVSIQLTLSQKAEYSQSFSLSTFRIKGL